MIVVIIEFELQLPSVLQIVQLEMPKSQPASRAQDYHA